MPVLELRELRHRRTRSLDHPSTRCYSDYPRNLFVSEEPDQDSEIYWNHAEPKLKVVRATADPVDRAMAIYDNQLSKRLEANNYGQYVAIHPDTGDYVVERRPGRALRTLEAQHPAGAIVVHYIGIAGSGLKSRISGKR